MAALATVADVEALSGRDLSNPSAEASGLTARVERLLELASATVRAEAGGQTLDLVEDDEISLYGSCCGELRLPQVPIVGVSSITVAGVAVDPAQYTIKSKAGVLEKSWGYWGDERAIVDVVYTHGYAADSEELTAIAGIVASLVKDAVVNPENLNSETIGGYSYSANVPHETARLRGVQLTESQQKQLRRYKQPRTSIPIRPACRSITY